MSSWRFHCSKRVFLVFQIILAAEGGAIWAYGGGTARSYFAQFDREIGMVLATFGSPTPLSYDCLTAQCPKDHYFSS